MYAFIYENRIRISQDLPLRSITQKIIEILPMKSRDYRPKKKTRITQEYKRFQKQVYRIWGRRCIKCGATENLTIHHMFSYSKYPDLRLDPDSSLPLCTECHYKYHECYPNDFTPKNLYNFIWYHYNSDLNSDNNSETIMGIE